MFHNRFKKFKWEWRDPSKEKTGPYTFTRRPSRLLYLCSCRPKPWKELKIWNGSGSVFSSDFIHLCLWGRYGQTPSAMESGMMLVARTEVQPTTSSSSCHACKASEMLAMRPSKALRVDESCDFSSDFKFDQIWQDGPLGIPYETFRQFLMAIEWRLDVIHIPTSGFVHGTRNWRNDEPKWNWVNKNVTSFRHPVPTSLSNPSHVS